MANSKSSKEKVFVPEPAAHDDDPWDSDGNRKKKSKPKQEVDEDDPTAGLDDLVDGVITGKPVALRVHEYVDGFQCMQCDFKVIRFTDFEWAPEADYLFFRNYYGKPKKLPRMLKENRGVSAYCCQCAFRSVSSDMALRD